MSSGTASQVWSTTPSNLPGASKIYDFVVAVTQDSINANLSLFVSEGLAGSATEFIYAYDISNNLVPIALNDFLAQSNNVNPFNVPNGTLLTDSSIRALSNAGFSFGIQAQIGIPRVSPNVTLPGWVDLSGDKSSQVTFNMMCSTFQVCEMTYGPRGAIAWTNYSQTPSQPAIFQAAVNLDFTSAPVDTNSAVYTNLPNNVKQMIMNVGAGAFSLQQLLFDLTTPGLITTFDLPGFDTSSDTYTMIKAKFLSFYFDQMKAAGTPLLGVSVANNSAAPWSLQSTSINFEVDAYLNSDGTTSTDEKTLGLATLNYLCLTGGKPQPPPDHFTWNWIAQPEEGSFDGVVSINRDSLVAYFQNELLPYVTPNCFNIHVTVTVDSNNNITYSYPMTAGQTPTITLNKGGSDGVTALSFDWSSPSQFSSDQAGLNGDLGKMTVTQRYHMGVQFIGTTIVITQTQVVWMSISKNLTTDSGNIIDRKKVDTFTFGVTGQGQLTAVLTTADTNNDANPSSNAFVNWFIDINSIISQVESYVRTLVSYTMTDIPLSIVQNFVLPGGKPFLFSNVAFATPSLDLVAKIKYVDPGSQ
ncbi:hypothetical protein M422DRAFT_777184 [Sphaerobolus stellatus SS14]|nr:hypothetical protein M422DRAFT_777184 [Sphaerobolus stellatus SS14]